MHAQKQLNKEESRRHELIAKADIVRYGLLVEKALKATHFETEWYKRKS